MLSRLVDVTLHVGNFRSFELMYTGAYRLRVTCCRSDGRLLMPYIVQTGESLSIVNTTDFFELYKGECNYNDCSYKSSSFYIDYGDSFKEINQLCVFRAQFREDQVTDVQFKFELTMLQGSKTKGEESTQEFVTVGTARIVASRVEKGMHRYLPVVFTDCHFCYVEAFVHCNHVGSCQLIRHSSDSRHFNAR